MANPWKGRQTNWSKLFFYLLSLGYGACIKPSTTPNEVPPNIILIMADDLGYGDLSSWEAEVSQDHQ